MITPQYFYLEESPYYPHRYTLRLNYELCDITKGTRGSTSVLPARLLHLTYAHFLRYCRDVLNAELIGKNGLYVVPYFKGDIKSRSFVRLLNARLHYIMSEIKDPNDYIEQEDGTVKRVPFKEVDTDA